MIVTMRGGDILKALGLSAGVLKIDVEGAELEVLNGFERSLSSDKPFVLFEMLPHYLFKTKQELDEKTRAARDRRHSEIERMPREKGYRLFRVLPDGIEEAAKIHAEARKKFDYLAVHGSYGSFSL